MFHTSLTLFFIPEYLEYLFTTSVILHSLLNLLSYI